MLSKSLQALLQRAGRVPRLFGAAVLGSLVALCVPIIAYLLGTLVECLAAAGPGAPARTRLSAWLPDLHTLLPPMAPLAEVATLLGILLLVLALAAVLLLVFYRTLQHAAVAFEVNMIRQLRSHAKRLAMTRTLSAQETALTDCLDYHLPRIRASLSRWWRLFPRHVVQLLACLLMALLVTPELTLLTLLATLLVVFLFRYLDRRRRTSLPVVRERAAQERGELVGLSLKGPLLESVHHQDDVDTRFEDQIGRYRNDAVASLNSSAWRIPSLLIISGILSCLFLFVMAVKILDVNSDLTLVSAFPFCLCLAGAAYSAFRLERCLHELKLLQTATDELNRFLSLNVEEIDGNDLQPIAAIQQQSELEHVSVKDSNGRQLLEDVSITFQPGQLIGVVATQKLQAHALVELLMGFGRPSSGRMLVDGQLVSKLNPHSLIGCSHWVASDGAIVTGTVLENIHGSKPSQSTRSLSEVLEAARLTETVQKLPDEGMTLITPGDDRLTGDDAFRIGIARAASSNVSVIVVEEPAVSADLQVEQASLEAIRSLVSQKTITVVIPQRLVTLRNCDRVVMLHEHRIADCGTHAELLQRNEFYRHLNYLRFNPFRGAL